MSETWEVGQSLESGTVFGSSFHRNADRWGSVAGKSEHLHSAPHAFWLDHEPPCLIYLSSPGRPPRPGFQLQDYSLIIWHAGNQENKFFLYSKLPRRWFFNLFITWRKQDPPRHSSIHLLSINQKMSGVLNGEKYATWSLLSSLGAIEHCYHFVTLQFEAADPGTDSRTQPVPRPRLPDLYQQGHPCSPLLGPILIKCKRDLTRLATHYGV